MKGQRWLLCVGGTLLFAGGLVVGRMAAPAASSGTEVGEQSSKSRMSGSGYSGQGDGDGPREERKSRMAGTSASLDDILLDGDVGSRFEKLLARLDRSDGEDFAAILQEINERGFKGVMREERILIISAWAKRDPIAAVEYLKEFDQGDQMQFAAMETWASNDPDAALAWARENHEGKGANDWLVGVIKGIATTDPMRAGQLIQEVSGARNSGERWRAMEATMPFAMAQGPEYVRTWIEGLEVGDLKSRGAMWVAEKLARENPSEAAQWISSLDTKEARREASEIVAARLAREDMAGAQSWVKSLPEDTRTEAAEGVVAVMAQEDPRAAVAWLENLGDNPDYDGAWVDLVERGFKADPGVALVGALRLSDEGWREQYTGKYLSRWMKDDQSAAAQWVSEYTEYLPPKVARRYVPKPPKDKKNKK